MKKIIGEFKKFITRGNIVDMAVGVIVGSSFTAIVNALSNNILKPLINWLLAIIFGANSLSEVYTMLKPVYAEDGTIDLTQSIYIDWGTFINSIINFFLIAIVLFTIVKIVNKLRDGRNEFLENFNEDKIAKADRKELKKRGIKRSDTKAIAEYYVEKAKAAEEAKKAAEEKAKLDKIANPTTEDLLKEIRDLLKNN